MKFRGMGKRITKKWLRKMLNVKTIKFQSATWVANVGHSIKVHDDQLFSKWRSICEPELFPGSRLISYKDGAKINVFNSGKCVCLGKLFRSRDIVFDALSTTVINIQL